jgi:hypothetical protein
VGCFSGREVVLKGGRVSFFYKVARGGFLEML